MEAQRSIGVVIADSAVSIFMAMLLGYLVLKEPTPELPHEALGALLMFYLALLMVCSYAAPRRLYILRVLALVGEKGSFPSARYMLLVYAAVFGCVAAYYVVRIINPG